jgi:dsDNA-binding SOS-regulon protein
MRDETRMRLEAAKRQGEARRLDDALEHANNLFRHLSGKEDAEAVEEWSVFLWTQSDYFKELLK